MKEKVVSSNFLERFNWEKARKSKNEIILSASPSLFLSHKAHKIKYEKQIRILSQLTVTELGPPVSESSTRISKFHDPTDSEHKFYKTKTKNWQSISFKLGTPDWESTVITTKLWSTYSLLGSQTFIYPSSKSRNFPGDLSLPLNCASALKIYTQRSE